VADFVGKVNVISAVAEGHNRFRVGALVLNGATGADVVTPGTQVRLYLRPEDIVVADVSTGHANAAQAKVTKVEFLGAFCHVTVAIADAGEQQLLINLSRHSIDQMNLAEGSALQVRLPADCMRLLA
jgi:iron(III) transport system ATP-binding protein